MASESTFDVKVERNNLLSEQTRAEEKSAQDTIRKAIQDKKDDGVPIALYDAERGLPYMQYSDGRREYYDEG